MKDVPDREAGVRKALKVADTEVGNFVRAIADGISARSVTAALTASETKR